ncbi:MULTISPECIES: 4'-phosphopantetheinyl transferase [Streptomyces]|uniref:4'-phosphopantetheinyl transferase superfamily protein n=1 Tax=Streptomyces glycanivorans TaxID=3033808 RepID=A0ABY9J670_9ACTN|nr:MULTISPECIES: 4'-phosphopantetheinyl transferase superfamily protein [unclassified Streptomyces]WSQ75871.1 4'-phosphopantetheinyl transferase superfamily protein [Streptomyces sp. NBC_01213]TXS12783.1 4'-phosphopantetheinyl transferase superfamily protein [Streptomyces sp. wa22]WLQ62364.1 4'-phosphopantetheinyl transferase superfamily protein [Streptomyces sp. Alt3]WSQ83118.1 4'-phosphopantetheinyl transferase superfamily protein [Streptomyces sp. NBC_01212]WSR10852.1 4'-phosphopantetheinyl
MIERLLPKYVACSDTHETSAPEGSLFPEEARQVAASVDRRRHEFAAVRACARRAMADLGLPPAPVLSGHRGLPLWPEGTVGSMTHCEGYRAAVLARASEVRSVGIDAEPNAPLPPDVWEVISLPSERARMPVDADTRTVHWDRLLFSAKESVFKTWFPLTRIELDFSEADISFRTSPDSPTEGTFTAELSRIAPGVPSTYAGRWLVDEGFAVTAIALPVNPSL